jgi:hypothetical protein
MIEKRLDRHPDEFYVKSVNYWQPGMLEFKIRVKQNSPKLWTERQIATLISQYNPLGFKLAFKESVREFVEEVVKPAVETTLFIGLAILAGYLYFTHYHNPESSRRTPQTAGSDV